MKLTLSFIFILSVSLFGYGQLGYLGKTVGIELGVTTNSAFFGHSKGFHNYTVDKQLLLPKITVGIHKENKKGTIFHWQAAYNQLPNSEISSWNEDFGFPVAYSKIDTAWTRSDNLQFAFGVRKYRGIPPLGFYFEFQFKTNFVFNKSLYRSETRREYFDNNYIETSILYEEFKKVSVLPGLGFSLGSTFPLNDQLVLDVGGSLNFTLVSLKDKDGDYYQIPDSKIYHKIISSKKVYTTNLLEFYVNIILFP